MNKNDIKPKFGPDDDKLVNNNLSNAFNHDPSSGIDKIKRYMEHLKVPGSGNKDGDEKDIMKKLGIMKKSLKIATLASNLSPIVFRSSSTFSTVSSTIVDSSINASCSADASTRAIELLL